jgi:hypothetical protein
MSKMVSIVCLVSHSGAGGSFTKGENAKIAKEHLQPLLDCSYVRLAHETVAVTKATLKRKSTEKATKNDGGSKP